MTKRTVAKTRARTKPRTNRAENTPPTRSTGGSEKPVDSEIRRAAARAGIEITPAPDPRDVLRTALAPHLIRATDLVAETLAGAYGDINPGDLSEQLADINRNLWAMRWELQLHSDEVGFLFGGAS